MSWFNNSDEITDLRYRVGQLERTLRTGHYPEYMPSVTLDYVGCSCVMCSRISSIITSRLRELDIKPRRNS